MNFINLLVNWFNKGGPVMWPILFFSIYGISLIIERWGFYKKQKIEIEKKWKEIINLTDYKNKNPEDIENLNKDDIINRISAVIYSNTHLAEVESNKKVQCAFMNEVAMIEKHLGTISIIATLLPMLGLLGTVIGMISSFNAIAEYGTGNPKVVASGISEALITTEAGLITSIPIIYLHQVISNKTDFIIRKIDEYVTHIIVSSQKS